MMEWNWLDALLAESEPVWFGELVPEGDSVT